MVSQRFLHDAALPAHAELWPAFCIELCHRYLPVIFVITIRGGHTGEGGAEQLWSICVEGKGAVVPVREGLMGEEDLS